MPLSPSPFSLPLTKLLAVIAAKAQNGHAEVSSTYLALGLRHGNVLIRISDQNFCDAASLRTNANYRAAPEWDLTDPTVIETRKDLKSEKRWQAQLRPYHRQVTNLITFCRRLPVTLLADDVGLGKTISAGLVASELIARARVSKISRCLPEAARTAMAG